MNPETLHRDPGSSDLRTERVTEGVEPWSILRRSGRPKAPWEEDPLSGKSRPYKTDSQGPTDVPSDSQTRPSRVPTSSRQTSLAPTGSRRTKPLSPSPCGPCVTKTPVHDWIADVLTPFKIRVETLSNDEREPGF